MQTTGFPSPAIDYMEKKLDLNELLVTNPIATFFMKVKEGGMQESDIFPGDTLLIDRSLSPREQDIVVAIVDGNFKLVRFYRKKAAQEKDQTFQLWGVVSWVLHELRTKK